MSSPRSALLAVFALVAGCTSYDVAVRDPAPPAPSPPGVARICVLRPHRVAQLVPAVVRDNGRLVGMTKGPSYFCYLAEPGLHRIVSTYGDDVDAKLGMDEVADATIVAAPAGQYFLHHDVKKLMTLSVRWVSPQEAAAMIGESDYVELVAAPEGEALPARGEIVRAARW
ncbi:hypothetical protein [Polyangium aurulentum]|uniref:hypothetical protein n=1 Tax=Polyangium aurulentum TaxID=2567896 RepID=UPI0010AEB214|nr:hypothetical protein [Polyangium aurulentum]UQA54670.1 hypothetical protein E8A73_025195 [Polyangium aurulentum]